MALQEVTPDHEPVGQMLNSIVSALEEIIKTANDPSTYQEVAAEEAALWKVKRRAELLCSRVREKQDAAPKIRVVRSC